MPRKVIVTCAVTGGAALGKNAQYVPITPAQIAGECIAAAKAGAARFFAQQAPSYQRAATWWVISAKQEETRQRRLATLIEDSERGRRLRQYTLEPKA